jgi:hypothetical protein
MFNQGLLCRCPRALEGTPLRAGDFRATAKIKDFETIRQKGLPHSAAKISVGVGYGPAEL